VTLAEDDNDPPDGDPSDVWCTADQLDANGKQLHAIVSGSGDKRNRNRDDDDDHRRRMIPMLQ
jgi:hypothetical protein